MDDVKAFSRRLSVRQYYVLAVIACFFIGTIIFTGAAVRVTGSGLGCSTWPKCTSESFTPHGSSSGHSLIEFGNRLFTGAVSLSVIIAVAGSILREPRSRQLTWLSWSLVAGVVAQIVLGGVTVLLDLHPLAVGSHMLVSMALLSSAVVLAIQSKSVVPPAIGKLFVLSRYSLVMLLSTLVVLLGIVVTAAGPHAGDQNVPRLKIEIETVARIHSVSAWALLITVLFLIGFKKDQNPLLKVLLGTIVIQGIWGYSQYVLGVPAWMVAFHVLLAAVLYGVASGYWRSAVKSDV